MKNELLIKVSKKLDCFISFIKRIYLLIHSFLNKREDDNSLVLLAFDIVNNIKIEKENVELKWLGCKKEDECEDPLLNLCCDYVKLYKALELLRTTYIYVLHEGGLGKTIFSLQDQIEATLYKNNEELWYSTQKLNDMYKEDIEDIRNSVIFKRFMTTRAIPNNGTFN